MGKAPFSIDDFNSPDTIDFNATPEPAASETVDVEPETHVEEQPAQPVAAPRKTPSTVARKALRKSKAARQEKPKYVSGTISAELDKRLKLMAIDTEISRQQALSEALDAYCTAKGY